MMKIAVLLALAFAGTLIIFGVRAMDDPAESADVAVGGSIFVLGGVVVAGLTILAVLGYWFIEA
jgi:hypothetical protein